VFFILFVVLKIVSVSIIVMLINIIYNAKVPWHNTAINGSIKAWNGQIIDTLYLEK